MANRTLSTAEIGRLVSISNQRASIIDNRQKWPSREDKRALAQAVKNKLPLVLLDGRLFKIRYTNNFGGSVFVSPDNGGFVPCGYFSIQKLEGLLKSVEGLEDYAD